MAHKISRFGWLPDLPDQRDLIYTAPRQLLRNLPAKVDLRDLCPPVLDQCELGSSSANAIGAAFEFENKKRQKREFSPSRLFIYYNSRSMSNTVGSDCGTTLRDGFKAVQKKGACPENMWPYKPERFADKPLQSCFTEALRHQLTSYHRIPRNLNQLKSCLAEGHSFIFGFIAYESFESEEVAKSGKVNMPKKSEAPIGGHAVMAVGYIESSKRFIVRNSWGAGWGQNGYFTIPYEYLLDENLSDDFWTIRVAEKSSEKKKVNGNSLVLNGNKQGHEIKSTPVYATSNGNGVLTQTFGYRLKMTI